MGESQTVALPINSLAFTICQIPVIYTSGDTAALDVTYSDGRSEGIVGSNLDEATSRHILARDGAVRLVRATVVLS
jgi:hypothetical protein